MAARLPQQRIETELHVRGTGYTHRVTCRLEPRGDDSREVRCGAGMTPQLPRARRETSARIQGAAPRVRTR